MQIEEAAIHQVIADPRPADQPEQSVKAFNEEVEGRAAECEVWCDTCWGSPAAQRVASKDQSDKAALPYFDQLESTCHGRGRLQPRHGPRAFGTMIGKDKKIALGVISHRTLQVERPEEIADLIRRALKCIGPERLILTSDCGFGRQSMSRMHAFYKMVSRSRAAPISCARSSVCRSLCPAADRQLSMVPFPA